jgi:hypothetical protein
MKFEFYRRYLDGTKELAAAFEQEQPTHSVQFLPKVGDRATFAGNIYTVIKVSEMKDEEADPRDPEAFVHVTVVLEWIQPPRPRLVERV